MGAPVLQFKRGQFSNLPGLRAGEPGFTTDKFDLYVGIDSTTSSNKFFGSHRYWNRETATVGSSVRVVEGSNNGSNYIELKSPNSLAQNVTYTLPATDVANGILVSDGSGNLSYTTTVTGSGSGLSAGTVPLSSLDIDGGTDIGAALTDGDEFIVDDGGNGTNRKVDASRIKDYVLGGGQGANFAAIKVTGISTLGFADATQLKVSGVSTFTGTVDINGAIDADGGANIAGGETVLSSATVSDLTDGRVVLAGTSGAIEDSGNLTFNGSLLNVTGDVTASGTVTANQFTGSGAGLSGGTTPITTLDIDGGTDVGEDLVDADLIVVDNGAGGTNRKSAMSRVKSYVLGGGSGATFAAINVTGISTLAFVDSTQLKVSGVSTFTGAIDANGNLDVAGTATFATPLANSNLANPSMSVGGVTLTLGGTDATPAFNLSDATSYPTTSLVGTITNAQLAGSIANDKLSNSTVSLGGVSIALGGSDSTPAFDLSDATNYPTTSLTGTITNAQLAGSISNDKLAGSIANNKLANSTVSYGGVSLALGASDATPAFDLQDATNYPTSSLTGTITNAQLAGSISDDKLNTVTTANKVGLGALDIDGGTDIGADLADGDLIVVDDGAGGTNRKSAMSRVKSYVLGGGEGATFTAINVTGISTVAFADATTLKVSGVSTFTGTVDVNGAIDADGGANIAGGLVANSAAISDLTDGRVVLAGTSGELEDSGNLTFNGSQLGVTGTVNASSTVTGTEFHTGAEGSAIRVTSNTISGPATITIDPAAVGDNTGKVVIAGDFQVDGTTTTVNSTTVTITDKNILVANGAANDAAADGGGITIESGEGNKTFQFEATGDNLGSSENLNIASGKAFKVNNVDTLNATTLGSAVVNSSLTNVGTLTGLTVSGNASIEGNVDLGNATSDTITATGRFDSDLVPSTDGARDLGSSTLEWKDLYLDGTAHVDTLDVDENAGIIGNATVGGTLGVTGDATLGADLDVTGTITGNSFSGSGSGLSAGTTPITTLDIDGGTDIGADLVDADLIVVDDGAGGTNRKSTMSRVKNYVLGGGQGATFAAINVTGISTLAFVDSTQLKVSGISTFTGAIDANGGATIDNIQIGVTGDNEIDTASGNLTIDSAGGTTTLDDDVVVSGSVTASGTLTANGNVDLGNATSDTITATGRFDSDIVPSVDSTRDLGTSTLEWQDLFIDGTAHIDTLDVDENAGIIGNATVGGTLGVTGESTLASATVSDLTSGRVVLAGTGGAIEDSGNLTFNGTTLAVTGNETISGTLGVSGTSTLTTVDINGGAIDGTAIGANSASTAAFTTLDASGAVNLNDTTQSTSNTSGSLIVDGGVGIAKNLNVGGTLDVDGQLTSAAPLRNSTGGGLIPGVGIHSVSAAAGLVTAFKFRGTGLEDFIVEDGIADVVLTGVAATTFTTSETTVLTQGQTAITVSANYTAGFVDVYLNGVRLITGVDYTETNSSTVTLGSGATAGDEVEVVAWKSLGDIVNVNSLKTAADLTVSGVATATGGFVGDLTGNVTGNASGNAATATALETPRTIAGVSFDGTANISLNNNAITNGAGYITATLTDEQVQDIVGGMVTGNTESGITVTYQDSDGTLDFSVASQTDENFTTADHAKLDGIEANADVTDATNVDAAGAVMNSDTTTASMSFVVDEDNMSSNSATKVPTQQSVKAYVDAEVGAVDVTTSIAGDSGSGSVSTSQTLTVSGTSNEIETSASGQSITIGLPSTVNVTTSIDVPTIEVTNVKAKDGTTALTISDSTGAVACSQNLTIGGNLVVNGTTTQVNTTNTTIEDVLLELGMVDGSAPTSDLNKDLGVIFNYYTDSAKKAAMYWDDSASRFVFSNVATESSGVMTNSSAGALEVGSLYVNDCAGNTQLISCSGTTRSLNNISIDGGSF